MHTAKVKTLFPLGFLFKSYSPSLLWLVLSRCGIQNMSELVGLASIGVRQLGMEPKILGSSGILDKNWSSCSLKSISVTFFRFLTVFGKALKSFGPEL